MSYISMFFYRYANHVHVSHTIRTNYGDECDLPSTIRTPTIFGKLFPLLDFDPIATKVIAMMNIWMQ
jgi:hypothetical protein